MQKSGALVLLVVTTLASRGHTTDICMDLKSKLLSFYALYGRYEKAGDFFLLQNVGSNNDNKKCLRVQGGSIDNFGPIDLLKCDNTDKTQVMKIFTDDFGSYINMPANGKCLTLDSSSPEDGNLIYQYTCQYKKNQRWYFNYTSDNTKFQVVSTTGVCLTRVSDNLGVANCANLRNTRPNQSGEVNNQLWTKLLFEFPKSRLTNRKNFQLQENCLHAGNITTDSDYSELDLKECNSADKAQQVKFEFGIDNKEAQTIYLSTGKLLSFVGPQLESGAPVKQMTDYHYGNQMWQVTKLMKGWRQIRNVRNPDYCVSAGEDGTYHEIASCANIEKVEDMDNNPLQCWKSI